MHPRTSLREEALARQQASAHRQPIPITQAQAPIPIQPQTSQYQYEYRQHSSQYHLLPQQQQQQIIMNQNHQSSQSHPFTSSSSSSNPASADEARKQWRQHGEGLSQSLENRRTQLTMAARGSNKDAYHNTSGVNNMMSSSLAYSVRVIGANDRMDPGGSVFTVYMVEVEAVGQPRTTIEHRYSEFSKLNKDLETNGVELRSSFPRKLSFAGRIGKWTPSLHLDKDKRHELVTYRKIKLDIWLVELAEKLVRDEIGNAAIKNRVVEFFQKSDAFVPPCDRMNNVEWSSLQSNRQNVTGDEAKMKHSAGIERHVGNPVCNTMGGEIRKAVYTVLNMCGKGVLSSDRSIPLDLLHQARGLCFLTVAKGGLIFSGKVGTGLVIARSPDGGWSAPSAVGTVGIGWGAQIGADLTSYLIILNNDDAVKAFSSKGSINIGAELVVAVGLFGRGATGNVNAGDGGIAPAYAYAHSKGFFAGISLEGSILTCRNDVNSNFYGRPTLPNELLFGDVVPRPRAAQPLYDALNEALDVPIIGFRPSELRKKGTGYYQAIPNESQPQPSPTLYDQFSIPPAAGQLIDGVPSASGFGMG